MTNPIPIDPVVELLPCPFCGDDEELRVCQPAHMSGYWVVHCGCCASEMQAETEGGAIAGWNTRTPSAPVVGPCPLCGEVEVLANCATECPERQGGAGEADLIDYLRDKAKRAARSPSGKVPMPQKAIVAILSALQSPVVSEGMIEAARALSVAAYTQYRDRDGNLASIEGDDGEKAFIVPHDEMVELRAALKQALAMSAKADNREGRAKRRPSEASGQAYRENL